MVTLQLIKVSSEILTRYLQKHDAEDDGDVAEKESVDASDGA